MVAAADPEIWRAGSDGSPTKSALAGGPPVEFRFKTDDTPQTIDANNPIPIPAAGFNYSFWVHLALAYSGTFTQIDNLRWFTDGTIGWTLGTAGEVRRGNRDSGDHGCDELDYDIATGTIGTSGDDIDDGVNGHGFYEGETVATIDVEGDISGAPATIQTGPVTAVESSHAVVLQVKVDTDATQGTQSQETFTFRYDEI